MQLWGDQATYLQKRKTYNTTQGISQSVLGTSRAERYQQTGDSQYKNNDNLWGRALSSQERIRILAVSWVSNEVST